MISGHKLQFSENIWQISKLPIKWWAIPCTVSILLTVWIWLLRDHYCLYGEIKYILQVTYRLTGQLYKWWQWKMISLEFRRWNGPSGPRGTRVCDLLARKHFSLSSRSTGRKQMHTEDAIWWIKHARVSSLSKITRESLILINIFLNVTVKLSDFDVSNGKTIDVKNAFYVFYFGHFFTFLTFFLFFKRFLFKKRQSSERQVD